MFRRGVALALPVFLALAAAVPAVRASDAKEGTSITASLSFLAAVSLGGKTLKPGNYEVTADDTRVMFKSGGKMVAEAPIQWKDGATKSSSDNIVNDGGRIREIHFRGKTRYVEVTE